MPPAPEPEVPRELARRLTVSSGHALVLSGVRRSGKSVLQAQLMRQAASPFYCNFEDTRLYGLTPRDFPTLLSLIDERAAQSVLLDEVQEAPEWQRLVRTLLDRGRRVCVTGSNASLLGRELGAKLTGRHMTFEVFPFSYEEFLAYTGQAAGASSLLAYLDHGGFPVYLKERDPRVLQELLRDIVQRDIAVRHGLRETRHIMNLALFLLANTGRPLSLQSLTKALAIPTVAQTARYMEYLQDAYVLQATPKFSTSFRKRVVTPNKYYAIDNGLRRANSPQVSPDVGHRLENAVFLALRRTGGAPVYAGEKDAWECDFVTGTHAIQVCAEITPANREREIRGALRAAALSTPPRQPLILTLDQRDQIVEDGVAIEIVPVWEWMFSLAE